MKKTKGILKVINFNLEVRDALMEHCTGRKKGQLGLRGANVYLENLIRKDLGIK